MIVSVSAQVVSQAPTQHSESALQTQSLQVGSSQPGPLCGSQQGPPAVGVGVCADDASGRMQIRARATNDAAHKGRRDPKLKRISEPASFSALKPRGTASPVTWRSIAHDI